jgi:HK97 family phage prohead protease
MSKEIRSGEPVEIRAEGDKISVSGYAAVFNSETVIGGYYREQIAPGAFKDAIGRDDVMFLINHDGLPMARTKSGTLILTEDERGLHMAAELDPADPDVMAIVPKMKRGDLDKMSFAFMPEVQEWDDTGEMPLRTIQQASLFDVSIVTYPAYQDTDIGLRSLSEFRSAQETKEIESNPEAIAARLRMKLALSQ